MSVTSLGECYNVDANHNRIFAKVAPMIQSGIDTEKEILKKKEYVNKETVAVNGNAILENRLESIANSFLEHITKMNDALKRIETKMWKYRYEQITNELIPFLENKIKELKEQISRAELFITVKTDTLGGMAPGSADANELTQRIGEKQRLVNSLKPQLEEKEKELEEAKKAQQEASSNMGK